MSTEFDAVSFGALWSRVPDTPYLRCRAYVWEGLHPRIQMYHANWFVFANGLLVFVFEYVGTDCACSPM